MMKLKILMTELTFQILLTIGSMIYLINDYFQKDRINEFFIVLFFVGTANLLGFVLRISLVSSKFHRYYFFGVIVFFLAAYIITRFDPEASIVIYFLGIGGILFNVYYLIYGFFAVKKLSDEMKIAR